MKSTMANALITSFSNSNDIILDPFVGSGTIALESVIENRRVICYDSNQYGIVLTKAKLYPPSNLNQALEEAEFYLKKGKEYEDNISLDEIPIWVKNFYHPRTLIETLSFCKVLQNDNKYFLLACLLGILHHQRPGFLSYPASHSIPYLRNKKFPRESFPELYEYRELKSRIINKMRRIYKRFPSVKRNLVIQCERKNIQDYYRDNRLRLWFLGINYDNKELIPNMKNVDEYRTLMNTSLKIFTKILKINGTCVLVLGDVNKKGIIHTGEELIKLVSNYPELELIDYTKDNIKSAQHKKLAKEEWVIVIKKRV